MKLHILAIMATAIIVISCSDSGTNNSAKATANSKEAHPPSIAQTQTVTKAQEKPKHQKKIEKLKIDLEKRQVFIPSEGWISTESFWDIYNNHPEKLPGDIDFDLVRELENLPDLQPILTNENSGSINENNGSAANSTPLEQSSHPAEISVDPAGELDRSSHSIETSSEPQDAS